jgi:hypothetical protein
VAVKFAGQDFHEKSSFIGVCLCRPASADFS